MKSQAAGRMGYGTTRGRRSGLRRTYDLRSYRLTDCLVLNWLCWILPFLAQ